MEKDEIVQLLQYRRHDLVNDIQVIHGYASMQMFDKVQEKLAEFMDATENERKLHMLQANQFILWIETFRMKHENFKLTYEIHDVVDVSTEDEWITNVCEKLIKEIKKYLNREYLYEVNMSIYKENEEKACVQLNIEHLDTHLYERLQSFLKQQEHPLCTFSYVEQRLTCEFQIDGTIEG